MPSSGEGVHDRSDADAQGPGRSALPSTSKVPKVDEVWARIGGKQRVRIARVWTICGCDSPTMHHYMPEHDAGPLTALRCNPTHGGSWWTVLPEFLKRFTKEANADA